MAIFGRGLAVSCLLKVKGEIVTHLKAIIDKTQRADLRLRVYSLNTEQLIFILTHTAAWSHGLPDRVIVEVFNSQV